MRRCSRHGGVGRRREASAVSRGRDRGVFYRGGEAVLGRGDGGPGGSGALSRGG
jgi:hypothetical protein